MNEQDALRQLTPPSKIRPNKGWGGGVMQIHLTRACTEACHNCTQGSNLGGKVSFMPLDLFERAVISMKGYFGITALFGGQPTLHPQFDEICGIMSKHLPKHKRGLWTNALNGHGAVCRNTFPAENCNLNVHMNRRNWEEFRRDWPEAHVFGLESDSRHSPVFIAMKDIILDEGKRWELISKCEISRDWSALIGMFRGELRAYFCEIAYAQSALHQDNPEYPDTGLDPTLDYHLNGARVKWWQLPMEPFRDQVRKHCHECSVPLKGYGSLALDLSGKSQCSQTHASVYKPKRKEHQAEIVTTSDQLGETLRCMLDYIGNGRRQKAEIVVK